MGESELTPDAAYLIENGVPHDEVLAMPPGKQAAFALALRHGAKAGSTNKQLAKDAAYLIKSGIPYERVMAMSAGEQRSAARTMAKAGSSAGKSTLARCGTALAILGFGALLLVAILAAVAMLAETTNISQDRNASTTTSFGPDGKPIITRGASVQSEPDKLVAWVEKQLPVSKVQYENGTLSFQSETTSNDHLIFDAGSKAYNLLQALQSAPDHKEDLRVLRITYNAELADQYHNSVGMKPSRHSAGSALNQP